MKKLIDLDDATFEALSIMAIKNKTNLKSYIEFFERWTIKHTKH